MNIINEAFKEVKAKGPNSDLIARLGCALEQAQAENYRLNIENRQIRKSYRRLKTWFNRRFKYYKAHRDELLNDKNEKRNQMDSSVSHKSEPGIKEPRFRFCERSCNLVPYKSQINVVLNSNQE